MDVLSAIGAIFGGGATGLIGSVVTAISNYKTQKLKNEHDVAMKRLEIESIKVEAEANVKITEVQTAGAIEIAETEAFRESIASAQKDLFDKSYMQGLMKSPWTRWIGALVSLLFGIVDFLKALARPAITYYLMAASTWVTLLAWKIVEDLSEPFTAKQASDLLSMVITTILYMTVSVVSWYFADRRMAKFMSKIMG